MPVPHNPISELVTSLRSVDGPTVTVREATIERGAVLPVHTHDEYLVRIILEGAIDERVDRRASELRPKTVYCSHPDEAHEVRVRGRRARYVSVEFAPVWIARLRDREIRVPSSTSIADADVTRTMMRLYGELGVADDVSPLAIEGIGVELLAALTRKLRRGAPGPAPQWLRRAAETLRASFARPPGVLELADAVDVHPAHLARAFRERHGCSMGEFVRGLRVEYACRQLSQSEVPLAEIALAAGFSDQSHFSRVFKRYTGVTPGRFRAGARGPLAPDAHRPSGRENVLPATR